MAACEILKSEHDNFYASSFTRPLLFGYILSRKINRQHYVSTKGTGGWWRILSTRLLFNRQN